MLFIINPIAGTKSKKDIPSLIKKSLGETFPYEIVYTKRAGHATELAKRAVQKGVKKIIAVGGDGTVNEVASGLLNSESALGIIPMGSGNGLARDLNIPLSIEKAIDFLKVANPVHIDSCSLNGKPFFCTAGVGFDAVVGHAFANAGTRGLMTYVKCGIKEYLNYQPQPFTLKTTEGIKQVEVFSITFANAKQFGNNAFISPLSDITDGKLEVCTLKPFSMFAGLVLAPKLFRGTIHESKYHDFYSVSSIEVTNPNKIPIHIDGEPQHGEEKLVIKNHPKSLWAISAIE